MIRIMLESKKHIQNIHGLVKVNTYIPLRYKSLSGGAASYCYACDFLYENLLDELLDCDDY